MHDDENKRKRLAKLLLSDRFCFVYKIALNMTLVVFDSVISL